MDKSIPGDIESGRVHLLPGLRRRDIRRYTRMRFCSPLLAHAPADDVQKRQNPRRKTMYAS
jgi:hypothetical protein